MKNANNTFSSQLHFAGHRSCDRLAGQHIGISSAFKQKSNKHWPQGHVPLHVPGGYILFASDNRRQSAVHIQPGRNIDFEHKLQDLVSFQLLVGKRFTVAHRLHFG